MPGNSCGQQFVVTTFGESHGVALGCIVDGCPPGVALCEADIQPELDRRRPGQSAFTSQRRETDAVQILSGVFEGQTTGAPIGLLIANQDQRSKDYTEIKDLFRPGHADYTYKMKYGLRDYRGGGRASARETVMRVAAGAIAKKYLSAQYGLSIRAYVSQIGDMALDFVDWQHVADNPFFCPNVAQIPALEALIKCLRKQGDSIGAKLTVVAENVPVGLGEPIFDKLDAEIAKAMISIPAAKGVEIGDGFLSVVQRGTEHRDEMTPEGFTSNHAGGVLGGISTGQAIVASVAFKPASSIMSVGQTVDTNYHATTVQTKGRHDPCVGIRAVPIVEAMLALVLIDHVLRDRAQCGRRSV